jgi:hypothetical protein
MRAPARDPEEARRIILENPDGFGGLAGERRVGGHRAARRDERLAAYAVLMEAWVGALAAATPKPPAP